MNINVLDRRLSEAGRASKQATGQRRRDFQVRETAQGCSTGTGVMLKTVYAVAVSAIVAACIVGFPSLSAQVEANSPTPGAKADRADIRPIGKDCSERAWPYFEASCLRDTNNRLGQPREVRFVSADRIR
jgi:hypothetical protein